MANPVPLKSIYAFIAVTETGSMVSAASLLNVSHSAVSQAIKSLENQVGQPLLHRTGRKVEPNAAGRQYYHQVAPAMAQIISATEELKRTSHTNRLTLNMVNSLAMHWWIPRVSQFQQMAPHLDVRISNLIGPFDLDREGVDVALIHGQPDEWQDYYCDKLGDDELLMVCSPEIVTPHSTPQSLLSQYPAIYAANDRRRHDWDIWCEANGIKPPKRHNSLSFEASVQGMQAAIKKLGVFVTHRLFARDDIQRGLLTEVGQTVRNPHQAFYFACQAEKLNQESIHTLRAWLHKEFEQTISSQA